MLYAEIEQRFPREFAAWQARDVDAVMPAGERAAESFRQFYERCDRRHPRAGPRRHPGQTLALVAHGGVLECAYRAALGLSLETPRDFQVLNASINRFTRRRTASWCCDSWGEVGHLRQRRALDELRVADNVKHRSSRI